MLAIFGKLIYYLFGWLIWFIFIRNSRRARVIILVDSKVLLTKSTIGKQLWELPGGGANKGEKIKDAAFREIEEETSIKLDKVLLVEKAQTEQKELGSIFTSYYFMQKLESLPKIELEWPMMLDARWFEINNLPVDISDQDKDAISSYAD